MALCLLALPIFAVLSIFSIKYGKLTKDALDCLFRTITFRKCHSGLDDKIKSDISGTLLRFSPKTAKFFYNNYKLFSWLILIIFIWSTYISAIGVYNYTQYGNCNGPEEVGFCVLDPTHETGVSEVDVHAPEHIVYPKITLDDPFIGPKTAELTITEFGCYVCPYTAKAEPVIQKVIEHYDGKVNFQFISYPVPHHKLSYTAALSADCALEQSLYQPYHDALFENQGNLTIEKINDIAQDLGLNMTQFNDCIDTDKYNKEIASDSLAGVQAGVMGTPTFFINEQKIVGPKPLKTFTKIIDEELKK